MNSRISWQQLKGFFLVNGLLALLLAAPGVASANEIIDTNYSIPVGAFFVSPDGRDTNTGKTPDSPWTFTKAFSSPLVPDGATIVFRGGQYRNVPTNITNPATSITKKLTLQAYPHEEPWLKGSIVVQGWASEGGMWRKDGWNYSFPEIDSIYLDPNFPMAGQTDMAYINGVSLKQVASKAEVVPGTFYVDTANSKLYIGDNPAGKTVEATAAGAGLSIMKDTASGTVVRGLGFAHYANDAISVGADRVSLVNNTVAWNGFTGVSFLGGTDAIVRGNTFSYNGRTGIGGNGDRTLLEGNTISYNNIENFSKTWAAAGVKMVRSDELVWRNNIVENNNATGMWMDVSTTNATVVNNKVRNNAAIGIMFELSHKAIIAGNVVSNNGPGILIADSSSARVYNNTLSENKTHIVVKDSDRQNIPGAEFDAGITWITHNNVLKNNILSNATGSVLANASDCYMNQSSTDMIADTNYNAYYRPSSREPKFAIRWSFGAGQCSVAYTLMTTFSTVTGFEERGLFIDNVAINPFFVDGASGDYRLKPGSPALNRGAVLKANVDEAKDETDIANAIGVALGSPVDLGAIQSQ